MGASLRNRLLAIAACLIAAVTLAVGGAGGFDRVENAAVDLRFQVRGTQDVDAPVSVVAIDDTTLSELGLQWPFPRSVHAEAITRLDRAGALTIAYDVAFAAPTTPFDDSPQAAAAAEREDLALLDAVTAARGVVLAADEWDGTSPNVLFVDEDLRAAAATVGNTAWAVDEAFRRLPIALAGVPSFPVAIANAASPEGTVDGAGPSDGPVPVDYAGPAGTIPTIAFSDVVGGTFDPAAVRGRVVIVGTTAPRLGDVHATPFGGGAMAGPEINANAVATLLRGAPLQEAGWWTTLLATVALVGLIGWAATARRTLVLPLAAAGAIAAYLAIAQAAFGAGTVLDVTGPLVAAVLMTVAALAINLATVVRERRRLRFAVARFMPPALVDEVVAAAETGGGVPPRRVQATVLFADLRGFTATAERLPPESVIEVLNRWLGEVGEAVGAQQGTLVSYQGDGVMAVFGAPVEQADHADRALATARRIRDGCLPRFRDWAAVQGLDAPVDAGIGIATGPVMSGTVGGTRRLEYAAVGDTTNAAARLQALTKEAGRRVLVSDATRAALTAPAPDLEPVGALDVRGRQVPAAAWTLREPDADASSRVGPRR